MSLVDRKERMSKSRRVALSSVCGVGALLLSLSLPTGAFATPTSPANAGEESMLNPASVANPFVPAPLMGNDGRIIVANDAPELNAEADELLAKMSELAHAGSPAANAQLLAQQLNGQPAGVTAPKPSAQVPDPLNTAALPDDPATYRIPQSADAFKTGAGSYSIPRPTPGGQASGAVPEGLEDFYAQKVTWGSCASYDPAGGKQYAEAGIECGYAIVPLDYANPNGPTIAIGMLKRPATNPAERIGTLFMDPGGPGGSGMGLALDMTGIGAVAERFDLVGFDPRGVGSSLPMIRCESNATFDAIRQGSDTLTAAQQNQLLESKTNDCYKNTGAAFGIDGHAFISQTGTGNVVRDLDVLRSVVGDEQINYLGYSYGTSIGYQYMMAFPDNIRALILDAVVNPFENNEAELAKYSQYFANVPVTGDLDQIAGFQATFEQFLAQCAANDGWALEAGQAKIPCALGTSGNTAEMLKAYQSISQAAWGGTAYETKETNVTDRRPLSFADVQQGTIMAMYSERLWPVLNSALAALKTSGDASAMMMLADNYYGRDAAGEYELSDAAFRTIWCTDRGTPPGKNDDPAALSAELLETYRVAPFTDPGVDASGQQRGVEPVKDWCTYYQDQFTMPKGQSLEAMPNVLFIAGSYDSATPYHNGVVAAAASGTTLLTVATNSHGSFLSGSDCATQIGERYLFDLIVPTDIPGKEGMNTKDIYSNKITGNECQVTSFRPATTLSSASGAPGEVVSLQARGLVRNTDYQLALPEAFAGARAKTISDVHGALSVTVQLPAGIAPGEYPISITPADAADNDPAVTAKAVITVVGSGGAVQVGESGTQQASEQATPQAPSAGGTSSGVLTTTGVDAWMLWAATAGGILLVTSGVLLRRRARFERAEVTKQQ